MKRTLTLMAKARLGIFDKRMCAEFRVSPGVNGPCRKAICRAYAAGLVPTATTGGSHSPDSYHYRRNRAGHGMAVDFGLRGPEVGTAKGMKKLKTFQRKEMWRARQERINPVELIGPTNNLVILNGHPTALAEGSPLETQHDNHVHEAYVN